MKKKGIIIGVSIFTVALIATVSGALYVKNKMKTEANNEQSKANYFEIEETSGLKFKGSSIISKEQKIILDKTNGELNEVFVENGQYVEKDTVLFNYYNEAIQEQVDELNRQINSLSSKIEREKERVSKLEEAKKAVQAPASVEGMNQDSQINQVETGSMVDELKENLNEAVSKRDSLKSKVVKSVKAEIDGKVYINTEDPTKEYMKVISDDSLIASEASEFDIEELKVDDKVGMKIVSNNKKVTGKIIKIEEVPTISADQKSTTYKFYIKPDEKVKIGFSVELTVNPGEILIPKNCVIDDGGKLYVKLVDGDTNKKIEITAKLKDDNYIIENDTLKVGDKILIDPSEDSKEEV